MTLILDLTAASSNLPVYLATFQTNFVYNDNGYFNDSYTGVDQFYAGNLSQPTQSSVIMNGVNYVYNSPGAFSGDVETLNLGSNLVHDYMNDMFVQDAGLNISVDSGYMPITSTFSEAIYTLSHGGLVNGGTFFGMQFVGLTDYFAEQGTEQHGTSGNDLFQGFGGNDSFVFTDTSNGDDSILFFTVDQDIIDLNDVSDITDFTDLVNNHLTADGTGYAVISWDTGESVTLLGHDYSTFSTTFDAGDFDFA